MIWLLVIILFILRKTQPRRSSCCIITMVAAVGRKSLEPLTHDLHQALMMTMRTPFQSIPAQRGCCDILPRRNQRGLITRFIQHQRAGI